MICWELGDKVAWRGEDSARTTTSSGLAEARGRPGSGCRVTHPKQSNAKQQGTSALQHLNLPYTKTHLVQSRQLFSVWLATLMSSTRIPFLVPQYRQGLLSERSLLHMWRDHRIGFFF